MIKLRSKNARQYGYVKTMRGIIEELISYKEVRRSKPMRRQYTHGEIVK